MTENAVRLRLRVAPGATRDEPPGRHGDGWKLRVSAPPERGRANDAVVALLAERLRLPKAQLSIVSGHGARDKVVELQGLDAAEVDRRLDER